MVDRATPNLPSRDLDATVAFYAALGFTTTYSSPGWLILERGSLMLEFFPDPGLTRRNLTIDRGPIPMRPGERMRIGEVELEVVRIAAPCRLLDDWLGPGAMQALKSPRGGTVFRLLGSGTIRVGDEVAVD